MIDLEIYKHCGLAFSDFIDEPESQEYQASRFRLNGLHIVYRQAKITPKKTGQFVTCWKRDLDGITTPLHESDPIDFYIIQVAEANQQGQFIFPKSTLIAKSILATNQKNGKRGFRVYPPWDRPTNKQAVKTQKWQLAFFVELEEGSSFGEMKRLLN